MGYVSLPKGKFFRLGKISLTQQLRVFFCACMESHELTVISTLPMASAVCRQPGRRDVVLKLTREKVGHTMILLVVQKSGDHQLRER